MTPDHRTIEELHDRYCELTLLNIALTMPRIFAWESWWVKGYTREDLALTVHHIKSGIKAHKRNIGALRFSNLIENTERFSEDLAEARSAQMLRAKQSRPVRKETRAEQISGVRDDTQRAKEVVGKLGILKAWREANL